MYIFGPFRVFLPLQSVEVDFQHAVVLVFHGEGNHLETVRLSRPDEFPVGEWSHLFAPHPAPVLYLVEMIPGQAPFRNVTIPDPAVKIDRVGLPRGMWATVSET